MGLLYTMRSRPSCSSLFRYTTLFRSIPGNCEGAHRTGRSPVVVLELVDRVEKAPVRMDAGANPSFLGTHPRSEEHTSELQSRFDLVCRLLLEKKNYFISPLTSTRWYC